MKKGLYLSAGLLTRITGAVCIALFLFQPVTAQNQTIGAGLEGQALIDYLKQNYTPTQTMGYNVARDIMYSEIDNVNGDLSGVYTGYTITLDPNQDPSTDAYNKGINAEHTWPQSMGAGTEPAKSDMHHLFPTKSNVNSARNNDPLAEIDDNLTDTWYYLDQSQSTIPTSNMDLYAENYGSSAFEPREQHKGDAARAVFYFVAIYQSVADQAYYDLQKNDLYNWHYQDQVSSKELNRSSSIATYQGNQNPFVLDTSLVRRAFFPDGNTGGSDTTPPVISSVSTSTVGSGSATVSFSTNELTSGTVYYGTTTSYGSVQTTGTSTTSHGITLTGLSSDTQYFYEVEATDGAGNSSVSSGYSFTTTSGGSGSGTLVLSEVFYDTPGTDSDEEWLEIYNGTSNTIDLGGYTITDNNGTGSSYTFPGGSSVAPGSHFTVASNTTGFNALYGFDADLYGSIPALNNGGDALLLTDGSGTLVDAVAWEGGASSGVPSGWSTSSPSASTGESIYRDNLTNDTDSATDWLVATNNGDPQTQADIPQNSVPVAVLNGPYAAEIGVSIAFSSAGSSDTDGSVTNYSWDFGDGNTSTAANPAHSYNTAGTYSVTLTVTDDAGATGTATTTADITAPVLPEILFSEVFYDTPGTDSDEEWVELYNTTSQNIDLGGYSITDNNGTGAVYTFPANTVIDANSYFTFAVNQAGFNAIYSADAYFYGGLPALNNGGDALLLTDASGNLVDEVAWESGASAGLPSGWSTGLTAATGESIVRTSVTSDSDSEADWSVLTNNGDPATLPLADITAPAITSVNAGSITKTGATISWNTDEAASSQVNFGETSSLGTSAGSGNLINSHSITLTGLTEGTTYFYQVVSVDEAGNGAAADGFTFQTVSAPVSSVPAILITEVFYDTPGNESKEEWIEIYNTTSQQIDLNGWTLIDDNGNGQSFTFGNKHKISGNTFLTLALDRKDFKNLYGYNADDFVNLPPLNNGGDALILYDASGSEIDAVAWEGGSNSLPANWGSTSAPSAPEGNSIYRTDLTVDTDSYADWSVSTDLGNPSTQSDGVITSAADADQLTFEETEALPTEFKLGNYPNPFNPTTNIRFSLPQSVQVKLSVYNILGQEVAVLTNGSFQAGTHEVQFDATHLSSGIYLYTLQTENSILTQKMILSK